MPNPTYVRLDDNGLLYLLTLLEPVIAAAGEDNVIEIIQKNGVALTVQNKTVNIEVPTDADISGLISTALANGSNPYTTTSAVQQLIDDELAGIWIEPTGVEPHYEQIGSTSIDLSGYVQASEMHALTNAEIDTIFQQVFGS